MDINYYTDYENVTIAEFHEAIFNTKQKMQESIKNKDIKEYLRYLKLNLKLKQLLDKKSFSVRKHR